MAMSGGGAQPVLQGLEGGEVVTQGLQADAEAAAAGARCVQHWTYNPCALSNPLYALRLQLADTDFSSVGPSVPRSQQTALFSDEEYAGFLAIAQGDVTLALIRALYTIANNRAIMAIAVNLGGGGSVDFTRMAADIRAQAQALWSQYCETPAEMWAECDVSPFAGQRIAWNQLLRSGF